MYITWKALGVFFTAVLGILSQTDVPYNRWIISKALTIKANMDDAFGFVTTTDYMNKWFPFASRIREADSRPISEGKKYYAVYDLPLWGEYLVLYKVVHYQHRSQVVVESDFIFRPRVEFLFTKMSENQCKMAVSIIFRRSSLLFQSIAKEL
ncbi:uncharacterized protein LOC106466554 isoform X1 [Limulus polyphemus]|uniref:Uncharacterized protein LOC106466554 isoform X1 n=1 Tax=Limulus polyphemus TaxID=6850 RepID=A0ABM1BHU8_LIMPO|nr:uncharacterized protein LOC106466554 isoform X1 [Limulus polyphemus]